MQSNSKAVVSDVKQLKMRIDAARGKTPAAVVIRGAQWLDVFSGSWRSGDIALEDGIIVGVGESYEGKTVVDGHGAYVVPGFIDAHVHIESSMMHPAQFACAVLPRGTTSVIWDPHEIANVKGLAGIEWAFRASSDLELDVFLMVPSCVPSTSPESELESSGSVLLAPDLAAFVDRKRVLGLAEMMNWPGLLQGDEDVMAKLVAFQNLRRDGHCPGLTGKSLNAYAVAGIHSCHESTTLSEGDEKLSKGIHVLIREGSCAKDADVLLPLLTSRSANHIGFCSDDRNPLDIEESGHLDCIVNKALKAKHAPVDVFCAASLAPARMYGLSDRGAVAPGYRADLALVRPAQNGAWDTGINVLQVFKNGREPNFAAMKLAAQHLPDREFPGKNINLGPEPVTAASFCLPAAFATQSATCRVIGVRPGQIVTDSLRRTLPVRDGAIVSSPDADILKIAVLERHHDKGYRSAALVQGFGLKSGAIATSINHDCHNVIVTGSSDELMRKAVAELARIDGGIVVVAADGRVECLELAIGGLMTAAAPDVVSARLRRLKSLARECGCALEEPFLQLSFLALPVIPSLKITDRGLVDGETFERVPVVVEE